MALIVAGRVSVTLRLPGGRAFELTDAGPGETLGELPLIDGGPHSATARVTQAGSLLFLSRAEFAALVSRQDPSAFVLKRRFAAVNAARLRRQFEFLGDSLGPRTPAVQRRISRRRRRRSSSPALPTEVHPADGDVPRRRRARAVGIDHRGAVRALPARPDAGRGGRAARDPVLGDQRRRREGAHPWRPAHPRRARGPGRAFGYEGLIDGEASPAHAIARERALLLVLPQDAFARLFNGESDESLAFLDVVNRDLAAWLRQAIRPQARLAVRRTT